MSTAYERFWWSKSQDRMNIPERERLAALFDRIDRLEADNERLRAEAGVAYRDAELLARNLDDAVSREAVWRMSTDTARRVIAELLTAWREELSASAANAAVANEWREKWEYLAAKHTTQTEALWRAEARLARWVDAYLLLDNAPDEATRQTARRLLNALTEE